MDTLWLRERRRTGDVSSHLTAESAAGSIAQNAGQYTGQIFRGWRAWLSHATQVAAAAALLLSGVVYTIIVAPPLEHASVVGTLPGMVIRAPSMNEEAFRIASVLKRYTSDTGTAERIATALVEEGRRRNLDPALLVGVLLTEDITLDTMARSFVGASGLMQVMPFHRGKWGCGSKNLFAVESNICHGASVLEDAVRYAPSVRVALLRYNGCVRGSNTKNCHTYPDRVMRIANRTTAQMLAMVPAEVTGISPLQQLSSAFQD